MFTKKQFIEFFTGVVNSYSQVFFSTNRFFAILLLIVSFVDPNAGLAGLISVLFINVLALGLGFNRLEIQNGLYGFNALLTGLGIGYYFQPSFEMFLVAFVSSVLVLMLTTLFKGVLQKYALPYLSIPFLFALWTILASSSYFQFLGISMRGVFTLNNLYGLGGLELVSLYEKLSDIPLNESLKTYFRSLGAIFFQFNMLAGIIIAGGLLIYSRIAFLLSLYGFYTAYLFYMALGGNFQELNYSYVGFNYILTAIAIGGFFLIPSKNTFLWLLVLIPVVTLITLSLTKILGVFSLPVYALPFNIVVLLFIYALKFRLVPSNNLREVVVQQNSPEENLYSWHNQKSNIHNSLHIPFRLPFHGPWNVSQGYNGIHTHRDEWQHALDFNILDDDGKQFKNAGDYPSDYYCFGKTVLAPAGGTVEEVIFDIPDNDIGKINTWQNWGNSVVIKHADYLYSCCSHLKNGSVNVKPGDKVKTGQKIGEVGNSGRSPYPHLHFQFQAFPYIGSKTMPYPLSYYLLRYENKLNLRSFSTPGEKEIVENVETNPLLVSALHLIPGRVLSVRFKHNGKTDDLTWEVYTNSYNNSYILEKSSGAIAWFVNDNTMVYFTQFRGKRKTALYYFYSAFHKSLLAFQHGMVVQDELPLNRMFRFPLLSVQDFFAPFYIFLKSCYQSTCIGSNTPLNPTELKFENKLTGKIFSKVIFEKVFVSEINEKSINVKTTDPKNEVQIEILLH